MPTSRGDVSTIVVGVGYVGQRLLYALPAGTTFGLSRSVTDCDGQIRELNLDHDGPCRLELPSHYAIVYTVPPAAGKENDRRLQQFLQLLTRPPRRFLYLSTTGVYGNRDGAVVDETATVAPESARAGRRANAERELQAFNEQNNVEGIVLRVPGIYGPGRLGIERIRDRQTVLQEADANPGNRIHVDDLAVCCVAALGTDIPAGIYNVGDGDERTSTWFAQEVARQLKLEPPPTVSRKTAEKTFSTRRLSLLRESRRLDLTKMHEILKVNLKYPNAADGIAASITEEYS